MVGSIKEAVRCCHCETLMSDGYYDEAWIEIGHRGRDTDRTGVPSAS
ncbi:MAG: hypothetical protein MZV63_11160 [Marinilabiliales bacterium]|nr:hypothetical protein [Marinilabiliales bacterium]